MDDMKILDRLVSIKINATERTSATVKEDPGCNPFVIKAAYLENGIKQLIIEVQNQIFASQITGNLVDDSEYKNLQPSKKSKVS